MNIDKIEALILSEDFVDILIGMELLSQVTPVEKFLALSEYLNTLRAAKPKTRDYPHETECAFIKYSDLGSVCFHQGDFFIYGDMWRVRSDPYDSYNWIPYKLYHKDYENNINSTV